MTLIRLCFVVLVVIAEIVTAVRVPWWQIKVAQNQGPNACVVEEIPAKNKKYWTECRYWLNRKVCGMKTVIRYDCCEGFQQVPGEEGCSGVKPLKNILETARDLGARKFVRYIEEVGLADVFNNEGPLTLFAPLDDAFELMQPEMEARMSAARRDRNNPFALYHVTDNKISSKDFAANLLIPSKHRRKNLRINRYSNGMETVNCILIVRKDQQATNGIVHLIDDILDPDFGTQRSVAEIIMQDGRFSALARAMRESGFINRIRATEQQYTILAPSDEAFQKISASRLEKILADKDAREALLENHVVPHTVCLPAVTGDHKMRTIGHNKVTFDCDKRGTTVDGSRIRGDFTLGENGVLYVLDDILMPNRAKGLLELLQDEKLWTFNQLVKIAGLEDAFEKFGDYTLFVPSEAAMYSIPTHILNDAKRNPEAAKKLVLFHSTQGRLKSNSITDNQVIMSLDEEHPLRMMVYRMALGVENGIIEKGDVEGMNGVIHIIDKVLFPCNESAGDILRKDGNFTIFLDAMEKMTATSPEFNFNSKGSSFTFFAPTDAAFNRLGTRVRRMMQDTYYLRQLIGNHIVEGMMAAESFKPDLVYNIKTFQQPVGIVKKDNTLRVNDATVTKSDIVTINGIVHVIDQVLLPTESNTIRTEASSSVSSRQGQQSTHRTSYSYHQTWSSSNGHRGRVSHSRSFSN